MAENKNTENNQSQGALPIILGVLVLAVVVGLVMFAMSKNGVADNEKTAAQTADGEQMIKLGNPVVAKVNGEDVKRSDVMNFISTQSEQVRQAPIQQLFPIAQQQVVTNKLMEARVEKAGLADDPEVKELTETAKKQIMRNVYLERQVDQAVTQKRVLEEYEALLTRLEGVKQTQASHILVKEEAEAKEIIKQLDEGADFAELAKEKSTGPSGPNGGALGYFTERDMVPAFSKAAFALDVDSYSKQPVKTQFGWHVIKVTDRRDLPEPQFEAVKPQLEQQLRQKVLTELVDNWKEEAKIVLYDINGEKLKNN